MKQCKHPVVIRIPGPKEIYKCPNCEITLNQLDIIECPGIEVVSQKDLTMADISNYKLCGPLSIKEWQTECHGAARANGWWDEYDATMDYLGDLSHATSYDVNFRAAKYALMHSELSEGLEGVRKPGPSDKIPEFTIEEEELADTIIRIMDYAGQFDLRIQDAMVAKLEFNKSRGYKHGGKKV